MLGTCRVVLRMIGPAVSKVAADSTHSTRRKHTHTHTYTLTVGYIASKYTSDQKSPTRNCEPTTGLSPAAPLRASGEQFVKPAVEQHRSSN